MQHVRLGQLAESHKIRHDTPEAITIRYDGGRDGDGDPVVFAVVSAEDLSRLPTDLLSGLGIGADSIDGQGDPAFFVGGDSDMSLYVDTDVFPNFKLDLIDIAQDMDVPIQDATGDLRMLCGEGQDVGVPDVPAYVLAGKERIDTSVALEAIRWQRDMDLTRDRIIDISRGARMSPDPVEIDDKEQENDDQGPEFG